MQYRTAESLVCITNAQNNFILYEEFGNFLSLWNRTPCRRNLIKRTALNAHHTSDCCANLGVQLRSQTAFQQLRCLIYCVDCTGPSRLFRALFGRCLFDRAIFEREREKCEVFLSSIFYCDCKVCTFLSSMVFVAVFVSTVTMKRNKPTSIHVNCPNFSFFMCSVMSLTRHDVNFVEI
jgi:hypothetical protein